MTLFFLGLLCTRIELCLHHWVLSLSL